MRLLIALGHPAHYHLFKNVARNLDSLGHDVLFAIREKDVLRRLLEDDGIGFVELGKAGNGLIRRKSLQYIQRIRGIASLVTTYRPDLMAGTNGEVAHAGFLKGVPNVLLTEDDWQVTPLYAKTCFPFTRNIVAPDQCSLGRWESKGVKYPGYHELAYLHPNHFVPDEAIVRKYFRTSRPYFILRFVQLNAHHDKGIRGIDNTMALRIIERLKTKGDVYITAERELAPELETYRIRIAPIHMHHVLAFAEAFIGDSQTMAAESGVLGTPFIRFNDFVGKIGYLNDIENYYGLGSGVPASNPELLIRSVDELLSATDSKSKCAVKRKQLLEDKIDVAKFLTWFFVNYPHRNELQWQSRDFTNEFR